MDRQQKRIAITAEHLPYEIEMLYHTAVRLFAAGVPTVPDAVTRCALLESFALHLRVLVDFLWNDRRGQPEDALAGDFFPDGEWRALRPPKPSSLTAAAKKAGMQVAHLSYNRIPLTPDQKGWRGSLLCDIAPALRAFVDHVPREDVSTDFVPRMEAVLNGIPPTAS
jgi:hypothetical protein